MLLNHSLGNLLDSSGKYLKLSYSMNQGCWRKAGKLESKLSLRMLQSQDYKYIDDLNSFQYLMGKLKHIYLEKSFGLEDMFLIF